VLRKAGILLLTAGSTGNLMSDLLSSLLPTVTNGLTTLLGIGTTSSSCALSHLPLLSALCPVLP